MVNPPSSTNRILNKTNIYFGSSLIVLVLTTVLLLVILKNQSVVNLQAQLLIEDTESLTLSEKELDVRLQDYKTSLENTDLAEVVPESININDITREFDNYFSSVEGKAINTNLNFTDNSLDEVTGLNYVDASLSIESDEANFYNFLQYIETSGISSTSTRRLMEVRAIDINFSDDSESDWNYKVTVRIYYKDTSKTNSEDEQS